MIFVRLSGGIGNQLFQYGFGRSLSHDLDTELLFDISHFDYNRQKEIKHVVYGLHAFNIKGTVGYYPHSELKNEGIVRYHERTFREATGFPNKEFLNKIETLELPAYFDGFWNSEMHKNQRQYISESYFKHNEELIKEDLKFNYSLNNINQEIADDICAHNSIALHVRRGEYKDFSEFGTCSVEYYENAIKHISSKVDKPKFFIFTEDHEWVKNNINIPYPHSHVVYKEEKESIGRDYWELLRLMSLCDHFIIANSTFSWWGAWLSDNKNKIIISPDPWFQSRRILDIGTINNHNSNISIKNDYSFFFNKSENQLFQLNGNNFVQKIKEINDVDMYNKNNNLIIKSESGNPKIILNNINKINDNNSIAIKFSLSSDNPDILRLYFLTKDSYIYKEENSLKFYYYDSDEFTKYVILPKEVLLEDFMIIPSYKKDSEITLTSFEIREIDETEDYSINLNK